MARVTRRAFELVGTILTVNTYVYVCCMRIARRYHFDLQQRCLLRF